MSYPKNNMIITFITIIVLALVITPSISEQSNAHKNQVTLKLHVLLDKVRWSLQYYDVSVTINGITKTKQVWTGSQTCPDDVDSLCYTDAGNFTFSKVKKGSQIEVCAAATYNTDIQCSYYKVKKSV